MTGKTPDPDGGCAGSNAPRALCSRDCRKAGESGALPSSRLLTHWAEIVGEDIAARARPVESAMAAGRLRRDADRADHRGAGAPCSRCSAKSLRERVNACYGYNAIARIRITQTAPTGFAEGRRFRPPGPAAPKRPRPTPEVPSAVRTTAASPIADDGLRAALEELGRTSIPNPTTLREASGHDPYRELTAAGAWRRWRRFIHAQLGPEPQPSPDMSLAR
jgi:hypothetical protein